jgi:hypothetical protein
MKKNATDRLILMYSGALLTLLGFSALSWFLIQPYRTRSWMAAISVIIVALFLTALAKYSANVTALWLTNWLAIVMYVCGAVAALHVLRSLAWHQMPVYPALSAWAIVVAAVFLATHWTRGEAKAEVCYEAGTRDLHVSPPCEEKMASSHTAEPEMVS